MQSAAKCCSFEKAGRVGEIWEGTADPVCMYAYVYVI